ncbi:periplasmic hemin-binding protein (plasmid) [Ketogulonicigenium robustum]|uniref:Periplasmic hemin-binding protein n=1 Tax=Ketogulonicigenium robustum TaxID=92947 RepID=A0A1W6P3F9_9RHOB|nr:ABC transporter substrate-binding protein [Ketogulonicigenium robustum]ARO15959.1 periplasmic hemin-binding protein [Ketogulonicigenium robustum]
MQRRHFLAAAGGVLFAPRAGFADVLDASNQPVLPRATGRIISLGPDISEIIFALGAGGRVVARDQSSTFPAALADLPSLGQRRALSPEGVMSVAADLIIAAEDIGPVDVVELLAQRFIPFVTVPRDFSLAGILRKVQIIAAAVDRVTAGEALSREIAADYAAAEALSAGIPLEARPRTVFFHGLLRFSAAGRNTAAGEIMRAAGGNNVFADHEGYLQASPELILERDPEVVILMPDGHGGPLAADVFAMPAFQASAAARNNALVVLEDNLMIGFGPRTAGQIRRLAQVLYP